MGKEKNEEVKVPEPTKPVAREEHYVVVKVATETANVMQDKETGEQIEMQECLVRIMNDIEIIKKVLL